MIDLNRHAAHDLDKVAGGVFGGEGGEAGAAALLDAVDVAAQLQVRIGIDIHRTLAGRAACRRAGFLEVRGDPDLRRDDVEDLLSGLHEGAEVDVALVTGRPAARAIGVGQVDLGGREIGLGLLDLRLALFDGVLGRLDSLLHEVGDLHLGLR